MAEMKVMQVGGVAKASGKPFTAYVIDVIDDNGEEFVSDYFFPRWRRAENGKPLPMRPKI